MLKLNRKGYMAVEIILASVVAITIAIFLIDITVKLVNKTDDYHVDTVFVNDKALIIKNIKEEMQNDINSNGIITDVVCSDNKCTITYTNGVSRDLSINQETSEIVYNSYTKKIDSRLSGEVSISSNMSSNYSYIVINIGFSNIFNDNDYDMIIPVFNIKEVINYEVELYIEGRYGNGTTTIRFDDSDIKVVNIYNSWDQYFASSSNTTTLVCYTNVAKTTLYDFETLDTIRYQGYVIQITPSVPTKLYCSFYENY